MEVINKRIRSRAAVIGLVAAMVLIVSTTASAWAPLESGVVDRSPILNARIFFGEGLIVLTGPSLQEGCFGLFEDDPAITVNTPGGQTVINVSYVDGVFVFDDEGFADPLDWLFGRACPEIWAGGSGPEPLATGEGQINGTLRIDADGVVHGHVGVSASRLTTSEGTRVHLNAHGEAGAFPDFVNYGG